MTLLDPDPPDLTKMSDPTLGERNPVALDAQWSAVARGYRNALILAAVLGVIAVGAAFAAHEPFVGPFVCVGLGLGAYNARKLWSETTSLDGTEQNARTAIMKTSLSRLGIITVFAVLVALVYRQDGWAVFVGLVLFQLVMMALLIKPLRRVIAP
jgi:uncharacterized membrane protein YgdD (TMEM256/DUF423 family)